MQILQLLFVRLVTQCSTLSRLWSVQTAGFLHVSHFRFCQHSICWNECHRPHWRPSSLSLSWGSRQCQGLPFTFTCVSWHWRKQVKFAILPPLLHSHDFTKNRVVVNEGVCQFCSLVGTYCMHILHIVLTVNWLIALNLLHAHTMRHSVDWP